MRLGTLKNGTRDGALVVVARSGECYADARDIAPNLQGALDDWARTRPLLGQRAEALESGACPVFPLDCAALAAPLPRAYEWIDASAYIQHVVLVRKARGAEPPATLETDPMVYQGGSGVLLGPNDDIPLSREEDGLDFEAEVCVVLDDTPRGTRRERASEHIALLMLANDVTLRALVPGELQKGFGFFVSKPATAFSPFAITPDELGGAFREGRVHLRLRSTLNGTLVGDPEAGPEMHFSFFDLVQHISQTRRLTAGTILGSGTVSNRDPARGVSCLAERRMRETIEEGAPKTRFLRVGDVIRIEMLDGAGKSLFGAIEQRVVPG